LTVPTRAASIVCAVLAIIVCAWFALGIRQARDTNRAQSIVTSARTISPAQAERATSLLQSARTLNPDREVDILEAQADVERGALEAARHILLAVTRAEPENIEGWAWLARASSNDPKLFLLALARARKLEPIVPPGG
jgi:predicted Zn-dependent protease